MMKFLRLHFILSALCLLSYLAKSQSLPVGNQVEDYYRRAQLLGLVDSNASFTIRPINPVEQFQAKSTYITDNKDKYKTGFVHLSTFNNPVNNLSGSLLPVTILMQFNSDHPYGWNDGPMVPSKGLQTYLSAGFYAKYGPLTMQLQPEFVFAANNDFDDFNKNHYPVITSLYYDFYNFIDLPTRFGSKSYNRAFWGQSSIRLNYKQLSFGLSTENLWWGPGLRNSLIISNDAPGFAHFTLNTTKPIKTPIGSFEGQIIAGSLQNSNYGPLTPDRYYFSTNLYIPKADLSRHISGLVFTWQPKWVRGLFLGLTRSSQLYSKDVNGITDYFPFFNEFRRVTADQPVYNKKDYRSSIFARWLWPTEHAEVYFEYGHNNNSNDLKDEALEPQDSRAYVVGLRKMVPFNSARNENILISIEATQLAETSFNRVQNVQSWYINKYITQGYTNLGQSLGAGIGPGGNLQSVDVSWVRGIKKLGLQIERYIHNDDLYYYIFSGTQNYSRHWVDLSLGANGIWNYKNFIFNAQLQYIHSINYQYYFDPALEIPGSTDYLYGKTANNLHLQAGVSYRF